MTERLMQDVYRKIRREETLINGARAMRQSTDNSAVQQRLDGQIRESQRNLGYLKERQRELENRAMQQNTQGMENLNTGDGYHQGQQLVPPNKPFAPRPRPNYSKLDLIKYDTPYLGPRIQLMLSQVGFKLSVERQYKEGIEKMIKLYQIEGDRRSGKDAESKRIESTQKIQLLKQALKRYGDLHVDIDMGDDADDDSINTPNIRKPLTGRLHVRILAVKDVDHASTSRFARGPETFVIIKVEDVARIRTKSTRNDKWLDEGHDIDVDKANEIEVTVYDKPGEQHLPIGMLWIRISDLVEELRRKKIDQDNQNAGWVSADKMGPGRTSDGHSYSGSVPSSHVGAGNTGMYMNTSGQVGAQPTQVQSPNVDAWFALEPIGQIHLSMNFVKTKTGGKRPMELGLGRQGAVRARKEEIHEMYGHKFVRQQFYNIMRCALCGELLKYSAGMQCSDCKYTCHKDCYQKVVTKCISKSNAESDPEEEKLNHRIPHRFEPMTNIGANWCCHCGYMLPVGKKNTRRCSECSLTCHTQCMHLVPDFCGMSMEKANEILRIIRMRKSNPPGPRKPAAPPAAQRPTSEPPYGSTPDHRNSVQPDVPLPGGDQHPHHQPYPPSSPSPVTSGSGYPPQSPTYDPRQPYQQQPGKPQLSQSIDMSPAKQAAKIALERPPSGPSSGPPPGGYAPPPGPPPSGGYMPPRVPVTPAPNAPYQPMPPQQTYPSSNTGYQPHPASPPPGPPVHIPPPPKVQPPLQQHIPPPPPPGPPTAPKQQRPQKIGLDHFNFLAVLGKGNFGKVMLAETKASKQLYAIKVLKKEFIIENDEVESTRSEKRVFLIANKERHPFLLNLHACFQTETRVYFVMEYISGGDLMLHIQRGQFGSKRAQFYAAEVCLALKYFHENGVIYRDLKLDNILLTLDGHIKIADYGLCKEEMWYGHTTTTFCGTPEFMAPEILMDKRYGRAVDWWAFGVLIYQMLLQQSPFRGDDEDEIYDAILADEPLYPIHMPRDSVSILQKLLTREPELRLGAGPNDAQDVMQHAFFRNVNWDDIYHKRVEPPFKPVITNATDTSNFDSEFTSVTPVLTPVQSVLTQSMQEEFRGFSYVQDFS
ncbi:protein kinase c [Geopyxis carbonaria]|nr:protein kinase c [Geopyxis carbonaria]